jgi:hypothetical protein
VELSDVKILDIKVYSTNGEGIGPIKTPSKYKKVLDKIDLLYVKNPANVKKLLKRLEKVVPKFSRNNPNYQLLVDIKHHIEELVKE